MQNLVSDSEQTHVEIFPDTPPCNHGLTPVIPLYDSSQTPIIPAQTPVIPPTHTGLSSKQAHALHVLIINVTRTTNYTSIGAAVGITKSAARSAVNQLVKKKYISVPVTVRDGVFQGFSYWTDNAKCQQFLEAGGALNEKYPALNTPPTHTVCPPFDPTHTHSSSFKLDSKLTTKTVNLDDPELLWWTDQGLTNTQTISWLDQFRMKPEELALSLRFARFDAAVNGIKPNGKPIENPQNWFYTILKRAGAYPRPKNYKSVHEIRADELADQLRLDEIALAKIWEAEIEIKFRELMDDKESPLFLELLCCVNDFAKENQDALEISMKELLKEKYPMVHSRCIG